MVKYSKKLCLSARLEQSTLLSETDKILLRRLRSVGHGKRKGYEALTAVVKQMEKSSIRVGEEKVKSGSLPSYHLCGVQENFVNMLQKLFTLPLIAEKHILFWYNHPCFYCMQVSRIDWKSQSRRLEITNVQSLVLKVKRMGYSDRAEFTYVRVFPDKDWIVDILDTFDEIPLEKLHQILDNWIRKQKTYSYLPFAGKQKVSDKLSLLDSWMRERHATLVTSHYVPALLEFLTEKMETIQEKPAKGKVYTEDDISRKQREELFVQYIQPNINLIYFLCMKYTYNPFYIDRNFSEAILNFYSYIHTYDPARKLSTWIECIVHRQIARQSMEDKKMEYTKDIPIEKIHSADFYREDPEPDYMEKWIDRRDFMSRVKNMSYLFREVFMFRMAGLKLAEIAEIQHAEGNLPSRSIETVKARVLIAKIKMKELLQQQEEVIQN